MIAGQKSKFLQATNIMSIQLHWEDEAPSIKAATIYPYPDLTRLWLRVALSVFASYPNLDVIVKDPNNEEVATLSVIEVRDQELSYTLHLRKKPQPDATYRAELRLTREAAVLAEKTIEFPLTFVDPDAA